MDDHSLALVNDGTSMECIDDVYLASLAECQEECVRTQERIVVRHASGMHRPLLVVRNWGSVL